MPDGRIRVGEVEVLGLSDATLDYPWSLAELFPETPAAVWDEYRHRFPESFGGPSVYPLGLDLLPVASARPHTAGRHRHGPGGCAPRACVRGLRSAPGQARPRMPDFVRSRCRFRLSLSLTSPCETG